MIKTYSLASNHEYHKQKKQQVVFLLLVLNKNRFFIC